MADTDEVVSNDEENKLVKATKRTAKRTPASKKAPASKKMKPSPAAKGKSKTVTKSTSKTKIAVPSDQPTIDVTRAEAGKDVPGNGVSAPASEVKAISPTKMSIDDRRKAIQAERLCKQQEMEALLVQEEELLKAAEEAELDKSQLKEELLLDDTEVVSEGIRESADSSYGTRSEIESSHDEEKQDIQDDIKDEFESMDDAPADEFDVDQSMEECNLADQSIVDEVAETHEPPIEAGLAGLDDDEEEFADDLDETKDRKRPISPVTWDVDVHARDDNISDDSPLASDDESVADDEEMKDEAAGENKSEQSDKSDSKKTAKIPVSNHVKTGRDSDIKSRTSSPEKPPPTSNGEEGAIEAAEAMRPRIHKYLYREAKYFMVKSNNHENVRLAKAKGVWSTPPQNEIRFNKAVEDSTTVILVFSVKESGSFQGFARINGVSQKDGPKIAWVLPPGISAKALSGVFKLDWISRTDLSFNKTAHLRNTWNQHKPVKIARDGQEIEPHVGESLSKLFTLDGSSDYERVISRVKRKREALQACGPLPTTRSTYRLDSSRVAHSCLLSSILVSTRAPLGLSTRGCPDTCVLLVILLKMLLKLLLFFFYLRNVYLAGLVPYYQGFISSIV